MKSRIIEEFLNLVKIDNESLKERQMADYIISRLKSLGYEPWEDDAGTKAGGNAGNVICRISGEPDKTSVMFLAHMDSVYPCINKIPVIKDGYIYSKGETVLGSDDLSGVAALLNLAENMKNQNLSRGDVWLVFTIAEEIGLVGARHLDTSKVKADFAYVLDSGDDIGKATVTAPSHNTFTAVITGKAAHAGMEPENGISSIVVASKAISGMHLGRIDEETTANIGIIEGGRALNIVCDKVTIKGEIRSRDLDKLVKYSDNLIKQLKKSASEMGALVEINMEREYNSFSVSDDEEMLVKYKTALKNLGIEYKEEHSGGGSDTNIIYNKGIKALTISCGMEKVHSTSERISINNLEKLEKLMIELIK
ncbi:MAG: M20/M25/M40 family metallo-hydrolase [Clostridiales bacterium]|nr:M20/M25/M40 family metallo-hydrolase [Clostridiales bacterium]